MMITHILQNSFKHVTNIAKQISSKQVVQNDE